MHKVLVFFFRFYSAKEFFEQNTSKETYHSSIQNCISSIDNLKVIFLNEYLYYKKSAMNILFIEDDMIENMKFERTLSKIQSKHNIVEAKNGEQALDVLKSSQSLPDIILLDLNMPRMSGIEFLTILKANTHYKFLPTIILTTSENRADLLECYRIGIAGYVLKPLKYEDYEKKIKTVLEYWETNELVKA
jgi:response regulator RpfG family c-di-GMP phosphodiesterase